MSESETPPRKKRTWPTELREIVAVFMLSVTAILTAWCGFESSKWSGEMSIEFSQASSDRIQSLNASNDAREARSIDLTIYAQWVDARATGDEKLASVRRGPLHPGLPGRVRRVAEGRGVDGVAVRRTQLCAGGPGRRQLSTKADATFNAALQSNQRGDNYSLLTVLFALVLFFSAMSSRNRYPWVDWFLLGLAIVIAIAGAVILASYPVLL